MNVILRYQGFEICRTSSGHLVVLEPQSSRWVRAELVKMLAESDELDALFFPTPDDAMAAIDETIAASLRQS